MKISTGEGDRGNTFFGRKISKSDVELAAIGTLDELNSWLGMVLSAGVEREHTEIIKEIQKNLFEIGSAIFGGRDISEAWVWLEEKISIFEKKYSSEKFVFPRGSETAARLHVARTVCRRAERVMVALSKKKPVGKNILKYLNRLSDLLFLLALSYSEPEFWSEKN